MDPVVSFITLLDKCPKGQTIIITAFQKAREKRKFAQKKLAHQAFVLFKVHKNVYPNIVAFVLGASEIESQSVREVIFQRYKPRPTRDQEDALEGKINKIAITAFFQRDRNAWLISPRPEAIEWLAEKSLFIANSSNLSFPTDTSPLTNPY